MHPLIFIGGAVVIGLALLWAIWTAPSLDDSRDAVERSREMDRFAWTGDPRDLPGAAGRQARAERRAIRRAGDAARAEHAALVGVSPFAADLAADRGPTGRTTAHVR